MISNNTEKESIKYAGNIRLSDYKESLTVEEYDRIYNSFDGEKPQGKHDWWTTYTPYGCHVIKMVSIGKFTVPTRKNYKFFLPVLERYFLNEKEYETIAKNIACIKNNTLDGITDTPIFKIFTTMKTIGVLPSLMDFIKMDYKSFIKLYLYIMGDKFMQANEEGVYHR